MTTLAIFVAIFCAGAVITFFGTRLVERAHPPRGRLIEIGGLRQHVLELGQGAAGALPVVLLHGAGANLEDMHLALGERLAVSRRVILLDRPGLGWSERKAREASSPAYQAAVVRAVLDRLGVERAVLVGHSWGGTLALTFALDHPQRAAGLVLIGAPVYPPLRILSLFKALLATPIGWLFAYTLALPFGALFIAPGVRTAFWPQSPPRHYLQRTAARLALRPASLLANWADVCGLRAFLTRQVERYDTLATPTIAITGDRDILAPPPKHCMKLAAAAPGAKCAVLPGYGHMLHHAAPDRIVAAVEELASRG